MIPALLNRNGQSDVESSECFTSDGQTPGVTSKFMANSSASHKCSLFHQRTWVWYRLLCRIVEIHKKKLLFHISFPVFQTDDGEANVSWSCCTFCCRRFEWLHPHLVIWWEHSEALTVCIDSMTFHSLERSSPALLCCLIESAFTRDYSCDYITKRCRQIDKDENPLYYLALILFCCGLFCFAFPSQIGVECRNLRERTRTQTREKKTVNCSWKPYKSGVLRSALPLIYAIYIDI